MIFDEFSIYCHKTKTIKDATVSELSSKLEMQHQEILQLSTKLQQVFSCNHCTFKSSFSLTRFPFRKYKEHTSKDGVKPELNAALDNEGHMDSNLEEKIREPEDVCARAIISALLSSLFFTMFFFHFH